jgi:predicted extracellular nuclease
MGAGTYAVVDDGALRQNNTTDLIRCAIIYKPAALTPLGNVMLATGPFERAPIAQLFTVNSTAPRDTFALVVNHFKSKASGSGLNADQGDGQGPSNLRRKTQSDALVQFLNNSVLASGTRYVVSVGDYNAYFEEDPMDILRAAGLRVVGPTTSTTYVFNGLSGSLDHAVLTPSLDGKAEVLKWNINSVEPEFLEYSVAGAATDITSPFRSSDHDPILIGQNFAGLPTRSKLASNTGLRVYPNPATGPVHFEVAGSPTCPLQLSLVSAQGQVVLTLAGPVAELQARL